MRLLLVTSRRTQRWVLPKGNAIAGLDPHLAAATEAYEEAGITGFVCPSPLGSYHYDKRRANGSLLTTTVDVYPLAFGTQLTAWPEAAQRDTRWFTLPDAAAAVDEPELKAIIAGFRPPERPASRPMRAIAHVRRRLHERIPLLEWFQALMPGQGRFFEHFESHAATLVAGADALAKLLHGGDGIAANATMIGHLEQQADDITRAVHAEVRRSFVTPFDRSAITGLIGAMDAAIDQMHATAKAIQLFEVTRIAPEMVDLAALIVEAARLAADAMPLLRKVGPNSARLHLLAERLIRIEADAGDIHDAGVKALFKAHRKTAAMDFVVGREVYSHLAKVVARFEDVANEVQGLVIDHS